METMGLDVSQKIRSAIKAKLVELGAYVDEELPDYIMVMVANKKTKSQMTEDLGLFLGTNTEKFTSWLHEVLERLQSVTSESKKKAESRGKEKSVDKRHDAGTKVQPAPAEETKTKPNKLAEINSKEGAETKGSDAEDNQEEVLAIKADFEADELLAEELQEETTKGNTTERGRRQNIVMPMQRTVVSRAETLPPKPSAAKSSVSTDSSGHGTKRPMPPSVQPMPVKQRILSSTIQSMPLRHHHVSDEDNDFKHRNKTLSSIVKVTERRPSLPPTLQANKTLILKAMEEAKKSVIAAAQKVPAVKVEPYKSAAVVESKPHRKRRERERTAGRVSEPPESHDEIELMEVEMPEADNGNTVPPPTRNQPLAVTGMRKYITMGDVALPNDGNRIVQDSHQEEQLSNTEFIVTLDGIEPEHLLQKQKTSILRGVRSTDLELVEDIVTPMAVDFEDDMSESNQPLAVLRTLAQNAKAKAKERCRYWPACKNGDICSFHHPSVQCKTFPRCKYGEKCLYIHPNCMFDASCSRKDCPYTHASKRVLMAQASLPKSRVPANPKNVRCKFFPQCTNMDCRYFHPKACRYGLSCKQPGCVYSHPQLPSPEKMKWTSGQPDREKNVEMDQKNT